MPFLECPAALDGSMPGDRGFDPLRFTDSDWNMAEVIIPAASISASTDKLPMVYWMREAELKHGRICMIAIVGVLTVDGGIHFPGARYEGLTAVTAHDAMVASGNMGVMLLFAGVVELCSMVAVVQAAKGSGRGPGDFSLDPLRFCENPETKARMLEAEITHARLGMLAFSGLITQAVLTGKAFPYF
jgi:light-harvesting complex I chlorophyll a/b binding protein 1